MIKNERQLEKYIKENHEEIFPFFKKMEFQTRIKGYWSDKSIGLADATFKYKSSWYAMEIKYALDRGASDFWDSLKCIGYAHALSVYYKQKFRPIIMLPKKVFTNDVLTVFGKLNIDYISVYYNDSREIRFDILT